MNALFACIIRSQFAVIQCTEVNCIWMRDTHSIRPYKYLNAICTPVCHRFGKNKHSWGGIAGCQRGQQPKTATGGDSVSRPYVPVDTKRLGEVR